MNNRIPLSLIGKFEVVSKAKNRRVIAGYGNIAVVDSQNQFIPLEALKTGLNTLLGDMSYANLMLSHNNVQIGKILKSYGKLITHVDDKGLYIIAEIRDDVEIANETWEKILKGEINGFSIGCEVLSEPREVCDANGCITYLDRINILEVSVCFKPVNQMSGFTIISKSDSNSNDVCASCRIAISENMETEIKKEEVVKKEEPRELSVEERIEAIERAVFNIQAALTKMSEPTENEEKKPEEVPPNEEKKPDAPCKSEEAPKVEVTPKAEVTTPVQEPVAVTKKDFDELKALLMEVLKPKEQDVKLKSELELAIKARDEQIDNMKKQLEAVTTKEQIKVIENAEKNSEPKTIQEVAKIEETMEKDCPIVISKGEVTFNKFV